MDKHTKSEKSKKSAVESVMNRNPGYSLIINMDFEDIVEYRRYYSALIDLRACSDMLEEIINLLSEFPDGTNLEQDQNKRNRVIMQSLCFAFVISYGRSFINNNERKPLNVNELLKDKKLIKSHNEIIALRQTYVAHEHGTNYEDYPIALLYNKDTNQIKVEISAARTFNFFKKSTINEFVNLINEIRKSCAKVAVVHRGNLEKRFQKTI